MIKFSVESVGEGHPDKVADRISDAILDAFLSGDSKSHVGCETLVTTERVVVAGEVKSSASVDVDSIVRRTIADVGYDRPGLGFSADTVEVTNLLHEQSPDIDMGVSRADGIGAGDQGIMFGYACDQTEQYMPVSVVLAHMIVREVAAIRREGKVMGYLRPDCKSQVTVKELTSGCPLRIDNIVVSVQHDSFLDDGEQMLAQIRRDVKDIVMPRVLSKMGTKLRNLFSKDTSYFINPTGKFVIGGPDGDTGLTGRKIIVDTYGGYAPHGGGAFSGKDPSKVDRSAAYMARYVAKNVVASGVCHEALVQLAYAIGEKEPVNVSIKGSGIDGQHLSEVVRDLFDLTPSGIIATLGLDSPIYTPTSCYGHFGRSEFPWERTDKAEVLRKSLGR